MGTWGRGAFQNDAALDWLAEDLVSGDAGTLRATLTRADEAADDDLLDIDDGARAMAAAAIVAAGLDGARQGLPAAALAWLGSHAGSLRATDGELAHRAVARVLRERSELRGAAGDGGAVDGWLAEASALLARLAARGTAPSGAPATDRRRPAAWSRPAARPPREIAAQEKQALLAFLQARGLSPTPAQRERIGAATDRDELRRWLARVATAASVADLLGE